MTKYEQARQDHAYLWRNFGPACDMTGGYVDSDDLKKLLENPTKATATQCFSDQIRYWFRVGPDTVFGYGREWRTDPVVERIAERHGATEDLMEQKSWAA